MAIFLELLLLQILTGYAYTFPGGNLGTGSSHRAHQPFSPPPTPPPTQAPEERICRDDRVDALIQLAISQHEEQMELLRTLTKCQCSGQQDNNVEYQEYIPQEEEPDQEVPEFPVPAPYAVPAPPSAVPYEDVDSLEEGYTLFPTCSGGDCPTLPQAVATSSKPSEVLTARKYQTQSTNEDYITTAPPPTRSRYQGPPITTTAPPVPAARKYQTHSTTIVYTTTAPPPTRSRYQSPPTTPIPPPAPTARKYPAQSTTTTTAPPPTRSTYQRLPTTTTIVPPVPTARKYQTQPTTSTTAPPPTKSTYGRQLRTTTTIVPPAPTSRKYQTQSTTTTTAPPPTRSTYQRLPTTTIPPSAPTAQRYQGDSSDVIPEEYDESRSFSIFPECDGDCPTIPDANLIPQQYSYEEVSISYLTEPSTAEYKDPPPVPEQGSGLGNYRTNPRGIFSEVLPVPLPHESYHEDLEEIVKELEENYPPKLQRTTTTPAPSYRGSGQWNYLPGYGNIEQ